LWNGNENEIVHPPFINPEGGLNRTIVEWKLEQGIEDRSQKAGLNTSVVDYDTESEKRLKGIMGKNKDKKIFAKIFHVLYNRK
jgi:hypothetical protein